MSPYLVDSMTFLSEDSLRPCPWSTETDCSIDAAWEAALTSKAEVGVFNDPGVSAVPAKVKEPFEAAYVDDSIKPHASVGGLGIFIDYQDQDASYLYQKSWESETPPTSVGSPRRVDSGFGLDEEAFQTPTIEKRSPAPSWSEGARNHHLGDCRPCAWNYKESGCCNGAACTFCHLCPQSALRAKAPKAPRPVRAFKARQNKRNALAKAAAEREAAIAAGIPPPPGLEFPPAKVPPANVEKAKEQPDDAVAKSCPWPNVPPLTFLPMSL